MIKEIIFLRHPKSEGNVTDPKRGIKFIGGKGDYNIIPLEKDKIEYLKNLVSDYSLVLSSPTKRCKQGLELITNYLIKEDERLFEINYGDADGLFLKDMQEKYGYLFEGWKNGEDPKFPNGENSKDVLNRYKSFLEELGNHKQNKILVSTHNVFLRTVLGDSLNIPMEEWFKISVPHFEAIEFEFNENKLFYKGNNEQKGRILKNL